MSLAFKVSSNLDKSFVFCHQCTEMLTAFYLQAHQKIVYAFLVLTNTSPAITKNNAKADGADTSRQINKS